MLARLGILLRIAGRNLFRSLMNLIIGAVILGGYDAGGGGRRAAQQRRSASMSRSIIGSVAGHIQVYSAQVKDELAISADGRQRPGPEPDRWTSASVKQTLLEIGPQREDGGADGHQRRAGHQRATPSTSRSRSCATVVREAQGATGTPRSWRHVESRSRSTSGTSCAVLQARSGTGSRTSTPPTRSTRRARGGHREGLLGRVLGRTSTSDPLGALEFLENRHRPAALGRRPGLLRYVGTDLDEFQQSFDRMEIVDGQPVPPGQRGFLFVQARLRGAASSSRPRGVWTRSRRRWRSTAARSPGTRSCSGT